MMKKNSSHSEKRSQKSDAAVSLRLSQGLVEMLLQRSERLKQSRSKLMQRYLEEGLRMDRYPNLLFRDGPAGRRAAIAGGLDVWEIVSVIKNVEASGEAALAEAADSLQIAVRDVDLALRYYAEYSEEIDAWIAGNEQLAHEEQVAWQQRQKILQSV